MCGGGEKGEECEGANPMEDAPSCVAGKAGRNVETGTSSVT